MVYLGKLKGDQKVSLIAFRLVYFVYYDIQVSELMQQNCTSEIMSELHFRNVLKYVKNVTNSTHADGGPCSTCPRTGSIIPTYK